MHRTCTSTGATRGRPPSIARLAAGLALLAALAPQPALATLRYLVTDPATPNACDPTSVFASGELSSPCYEIIDARIEGPLPLACPACPTTYLIRITVEEPAPGEPCPTVIEPYTRAFRLGTLLPGAYRIVAEERVVPYQGDPHGAAVDSSTIERTFYVLDVRCGLPEDCFLLDFAPLPFRVPGPPLGCDAAAFPGGDAYFDVTLATRDSVGGVQTDVAVFDDRMDPIMGPILGGSFTPISVEAMGRASHMQVAWTADGPQARIILFSATGAVIEPGAGPILRVGYAIGATTPVGRYGIGFVETIVSDPKGVAIPPCPTFAPTMGSLCVIGQGCDLNGDGVSDVLDVIRLVHCALARGATTEACPDSIAARADCNGDGTIDIRDVICCVRRILSLPAPCLICTESQGTAPPGASTPLGAAGAGAGLARFGFTGEARWISPVEGRARLELATDDDFAGIQFDLRQTGAAALRFRDVRIVTGSPSDRLEWQADVNGGVRAMLYSSDPAARPAGRTEIEVVFERVLGGDGASVLTLGGVRTGNAAGAAVTTEISSASAAVPAAGEVSAPSVYSVRPNPFRGATEITYALPAPARVTLRVYGVDGRLVRTLVDAGMPAGVHRAAWDGRNASGRLASAGIYFARFEAAGVSRVERLMLLR